MTSMAAYSRDTRRRRLGVDSVSRVVWRKWEPGNDYVRKIRIRNVEMRSQTIEYKLPQRKSTFFMDFPQPVTLSSGMSFDLEVHFRPTELVEMCDVIEVNVVGRGGYIIQLECLTPFAKVQVQPQHDFAYCAVGTTATHTITMKNVGTVAVDFEWEVPEFFSIDPVRGSLDEDKSIDFTVSFMPSEACALVGQAVCRMIDNNVIIASTRFSGIGKYPFIRAVVENAQGPDKNALNIDFGRILPGATETREFYIENPSLVDAVFTLGPIDNALSCPFTVTPRSGVIQRGKTRRFRVTFTSASIGAVFINEFQARAHAGNTVTLRLRGTTITPVVCISTSTIDFGDVCLDEKNDSVSPPSPQGRDCRFFSLKNTSNMPINFHVLAATPGAVFVVEPTSGVLPARGSARLRVEFRPSHPINYLRRLLVLTQHAAKALCVDLFGSAYGGVIRPQPFGARDVELFFLRLQRGFGAATPEQLAAIAGSVEARGPRGLSTYDDVLRQCQWADPAATESAVPRHAMCPQRGRLHLSAVHTPLSASTAFRIGTDSVAFDPSGAEPCFVTVYNNTGAPATAFWCVPRGVGIVVKPPLEDVNPYSHFTFAIELVLHGASLLTDQFLECYMNFKQMRSFRLVSEGAFTPPYCFLLRCYREIHASPDAVGSVTPFVKAPQAVMFPPCRAAHEVHAIMEVENVGDVAVMYSVSMQMNGYAVRDMTSPSSPDDVSVSCVVACHPASGIIAAHSKVPLLLLHEPSCTGRFRGEAVIKLNNSPNDVLHVALSGESFTPYLIVEDSSMIVFPPTCVTGETRRVLCVFNPTCIPIAFEVMPSPGLAGILHFAPSFGVLQAGERTEVTAYFRPQVAEVYEGHMEFFILDNKKMQETSTLGTTGWTEADRRLIACPITGEGRHAVVEVEPVTMEHEGPAMQKKTFEWTIYNSSVCEVCYEVRWMLMTGASASSDWKDQPEAAPQLSHNRTGTLAARAHAVVLVTLQPPAGVSEYILYTLVGGPGVVLADIPSPRTPGEVMQHPHCEVRLRGTRPAVQITDVRSLQQHRSQLWCQLGINRVNAVLAEPVLASDVESDSFAFPQYVAGLEPILMDMGVGSVLHSDKEVLLRVENAGARPASFRFWYPAEHEGGDETWFIEDEELDEVREILSKGLVEISPREGTIAVGAYAVITMTYRHRIVGTHCVPMLLRLSEGKKVLLVLRGRTVSPDANVIAFHHPDAYKLHPVALGDLEPPLQLITLENTASQPVEYAVHEELAQYVTEHNYGFPVFQCLNPTGTIPVGGSVLLHWYFRPLEAREYRVEVAMRSLSGEIYTLRFVGMGYHPSRVSPELCVTMMRDAFLSIPASPALRLPVERCPVWLSLDVLRIGPAPCFSLHRRVCYIENRHPTRAYTFSWTTDIAPGSTTLCVTPASGVLGPGERVRCRLALQCGSLSQIVESPVFCHVRAVPPVQHSRLSPARRAESRADADTGAEDTEDEDFDPLLDAPTPDPQPFVRTTCTKRRAAGPEEPRGPVTAVPRVESALSTTTAAATTAATTTAATTTAATAATTTAATTTAAVAAAPPAQPSVHALEVLVQARVMPIEVFERLLGTRAVQQTHFPTLKAHHVDPMQLTPGAKCSRGQADMTHRVLDELLRSVIALPRVKDAFTEAVKDPGPYYHQIVRIPRQQVAEAKPQGHEQLLQEQEHTHKQQHSVSEVTESRSAERLSVADRYFGPASPNTSAELPTHGGSLAPRSILQHDGVVMNMLEELLAGVTLNVIGALTVEERPQRRDERKEVKRRRSVTRVTTS